MTYISPRGYRNTARLLVLGATAAFATTAAPVHAQAPGNATVRSIESAGMLYVGGNADNNVRITLSGTTFTVDDVIPITAGTGCKPVSGDATKATCVAFKAAPNGRFKVFNVNTGFGNDKITNVDVDREHSRQPRRSDARQRQLGRRRGHRRPQGRRHADRLNGQRHPARRGQPERVRRRQRRRLAPRRRHAERRAR